MIPYFLLTVLGFATYGISITCLVGASYNSKRYRVSSIATFIGVTLMIGGLLLALMRSILTLSQ